MINRRKKMRKVALSFLSVGLFTLSMPFLAFSQSSTSGTTNSQTQERKYKEGEIIVKFKNGRSVNSLNQTQAKHHFIEKMDFPITQTQLLSFNLASSTEQVIKDLLGSGLVEYAEPNYERTFTAVTEPGYEKQWGLKNTGQSISGIPGTPGMDIGAERAWRKTMGSKNVVVGVIDSGVDITHPDLRNQIWRNPGEVPGDGLDNDRNGYVDDVNGWNFFDENNDLYLSSEEDAHGTHVSGIIAASNNKSGVIGVAPNVKIMPLKIMAQGGYISDVLEAIEYAKAKGVKIINMSLGGRDYSQAEYNLIKNTNALFVVAAGNEYSNIDGYFSNYPAAYDLPNIISVAAVDHQGNVPYWSNYGTTNTDLAAPGTVIYSTLPGNTYGYYSGTSMAAPFVTGTAALILSKNTSASPLQIKDILLSNTTPLSSLTWKVKTGGMLNAGKALATMNGGTRYATSQSVSTAQDMETTDKFDQDSNGTRSQFAVMVERFLQNFMN